MKRKIKQFMSYDSHSGLLSYVAPKRERQRDTGTRSDKNQKFNIQERHRYVNKKYKKLKIDKTKSIIDIC